MSKLGRPRRSEADRVMMRAAGERLRWVREALNLSQARVAEMVGVHQTMWSAYERGMHWPDHFQVVRICGKLRISAPYILEGSLDGVERDLAIFLAARHPELVLPATKEPRLPSPGRPSSRRR